MTYTVERLDLGKDDWVTKIKASEAETVYQTPAWLAFLSATQKGEPLVAAIFCRFGLVIDRHGRCIAAGIFPHLNGVMYFWGGASWPRLPRFTSDEAIQWEAIKI